MKLSFARKVIVSVGLTAILGIAHGEDSKNDEPVWGTKAGVTSPHVTRTVKPEYSREALQAKVQGTVLLSLVVNPSGVPEDVSVVRPLGFGLDEEAVRCMRQWRFLPGKKDGKPVEVNAVVVVNFRLFGEQDNEKAERERAWFDSLTARAQLGQKPSEEDVQKITGLAKHKKPGAECVLGIWELNGTGVAKDPVDGLARVQGAAEKHYPPAMYFVGNAQYRGTVLPKDTASGLELLQDAAGLGSLDAQYMLGQLYEQGYGVALDQNKAKSYYRFCAARGVPECEFRLGRLLLQSENPSEGRRLEGITWLQLAEQHHWEAAHKQADEATAQLTPDQAAWVGRLKSELRANR